MLAARIVQKLHAGGTWQAIRRLQPPRLQRPQRSGATSVLDARQSPAPAC